MAVGLYVKDVKKYYWFGSSVWKSFCGGSSFMMDGPYTAAEFKRLNDIKRQMTVAGFTRSLIELKARRTILWLSDEKTAFKHVIKVISGLKYNVLLTKRTVELLTPYGLSDIFYRMYELKVSDIDTGYYGVIKHIADGFEEVYSSTQLLDKVVRDVNADTTVFNKNDRVPKNIQKKLVKIFNACSVDMDTWKVSRPDANSYASFNLNIFNGGEHSLKVANIYRDSMSCVVHTGLTKDNIGGINMLTYPKVPFITAHKTISTEQTAGGWDMPVRAEFSANILTKHPDKDKEPDIIFKELCHKSLIRITHEPDKVINKLAPTNNFVRSEIFALSDNTRDATNMGNKCAPFIMRLMWEQEVNGKRYIETPDGNLYFYVPTITVPNKTYDGRHPTCAAFISSKPIEAAVKFTNEDMGRCKRPEYFKNTADYDLAKIYKDLPRKAKKLVPNPDKVGKNIFAKEYLTYRKNVGA